MKQFTKLLLTISLAFAFTACSTLRNQGVGVGEDGTVSAYNNLDRHGAIALFQSQEGKACYDTIKEAIQFSIIDQNKSVRGNRAFESSPSISSYDAMAQMAKSMEKLASESMKYASHMVAYSNGITPQDPIVQLASLCKRNGYYDMKMHASDNRHETYRAIASEVGSLLKTTTPYAALAYVGSKVGDRNDISGNNNALGDENAVSEPTVVPASIVADGKNVSTPPLPDDPETIPLDPNVIPLDPNF